jgi:hypothetical protein
VQVDEKEKPEEVTEDHKNLGFFGVRNGSTIIIGKKEE